ncbi:unnamed protein product [Caenorhabditis sp. 36 PRJEB53466]|nr:unnamed protein product [Caenorhabditis sp. 36 PRJEB53466]
MFDSRKAAYQSLLVLSATFSILSVIVIFSTFPIFYLYFDRVKLDIRNEMTFCKKSAEKVFHFVNEVEYYDPRRPRLLE